MNRIYTGFLHFSGISEEVMDRRLLNNACMDLDEMLRVRDISRHGRID